MAKAKAADLFDQSRNPCRSLKRRHWPVAGVAAAPRRGTDRQANCRRSRHLDANGLKLLMLTPPNLMKSILAVVGGNSALWNSSNAANSRW